MVNKPTCVKDLNRLNDIFFKSLLGVKERKNLTLNFINSILHRTEQNRFVDLSFSDKQLVPIVKFEKAPELDIVARMDDGTCVDIEVQIARQDFIRQRSAYYLSGMYYHQIGRGDYYDELKKSIVIDLLKFNFLPYEEYHSSYRMRHDKYSDPLFDDLEMHFIELKKFKYSDIKTMYSADKWIAYFSPNCTDEQREELAMNDPAIKEAVNHEMEFSKSLMEWRLYEQQEKAIKDKIGIERYNRRIGREEGHKEGLAEGIKKGIEKGIKKTKVQNVVNLLKLGIDVETISKGIDLSISEVEAIKKTLK